LTQAKQFACLGSKILLRYDFYLVTNIFPDGKISRPQLGIFAFRHAKSMAQTKIYLRFQKSKKVKQFTFS